jgi:hypothetical protein
MGYEGFGEAERGSIPISEPFSVHSMKRGKKGQESHFRRQFLKNTFPNLPLFKHIKFSVTHVTVVTTVTFLPGMVDSNTDNLGLGTEILRN